MWTFSWTKKKNNCFQLCHYARLEDRLGSCSQHSEFTQLIKMQSFSLSGKFSKLYTVFTQKQQCLFLWATVHYNENLSESWKHFFLIIEYNLAHKYELTDLLNWLELIKHLNLTLEMDVIVHIVRKCLFFPSFSLHWTRSCQSDIQEKQFSPDESTQCKMKTGLLIVRGQGNCHVFSSNPKHSLKYPSAKSLKVMHWLTKPWLNPKTDLNSDQHWRNKCFHLLVGNTNFRVCFFFFFLSHFFFFYVDKSKQHDELNNLSAPLCIDRAVSFC